MKESLIYLLKERKIGKGIMLALLCVALAGCSVQKETTVTRTSTNEPAAIVTMEPSAAATEIATAAPLVAPAESDDMLIEMPGITLQLPGELNEYLEHEQSVYGNAITETFYLKAGENRIPLYRIDVGDENLGDWLGMLKVEDGNVPVTFTVFSVSEEERAACGEGIEDIYDVAMNSFNTIVEGIFSDSRFNSEKPLDVGVDGEVQMAYWTVVLPSSMSYTETMENGNYQVVFSGEMNGAKYALYSVRIGELEEGEELGLFTIDGVAKRVYIENYGISEHETWTADDYAAAYRMLDTINDVVQQIVSSENFSELTGE